MIIKYIKSFFYIMLLLINSLSCIEFDFDKREIKIPDKVVFIDDDGEFGLGQERANYIIDDSDIDYIALEQHYKDITNNNNELEHERDLLQRFINDFYGSQCKVTNIDSYKAADGGYVVEIIISPQLFMKDKDGRVVPAPFDNYGTNLTSGNVCMISKNGDELHLDSNIIMMMRIIKTMKLSDIRMSNYILCALPDQQKSIISLLCQSFIRNIMEVVALDKNNKDEPNIEIQKPIDMLHLILEDIESMQLSVGEFIAQNGALLRGDPRRLSKEVVGLLKESGLQNNIHDILAKTGEIYKEINDKDVLVRLMDPEKLSVEEFIEHNKALIGYAPYRLSDEMIRLLVKCGLQTNITDAWRIIKTNNTAINQEINNGLFAYGESYDEFIEDFRWYSTRESPSEHLKYYSELHEHNPKPIEFLFVRAFCIYLDMLEILHLFFIAQTEYNKRVIEIDKKISIEDDECGHKRFYLEGKQECMLDDSKIDYIALAQHYKDITNNNNELEYERDLLQSFINDFYGPEFKVTDIAFGKAPDDNSDVVLATMSPQLFMKNEDGTVVPAEFGKYGMNLTSGNVCMISKNGDELPLNTNIMMVDIIIIMKTDNIQILRYILCALPHLQQLIISNLCKSFISEITELLSYDEDRCQEQESDEDRCQEQESDEDSALSQEEITQLRDKAQEEINMLNAIFEDIKSMELSVQEFIEKNQQLSAGDAKKLTDDEILALREGGAKNNIHDVLINISTTNIEIYQAISNKLFVFDRNCDALIKQFERDSMEETAIPNLYLYRRNLNPRLNTKRLRPIERLFIKAFITYNLCYNHCDKIRQVTRS